MRSFVGIKTGLLAVSFGLAACSADVSVESAGVFTSPGGSAALIVTRSNYGATVPYVYRFYVKQPDSELEEKLEVLRTDSFEGMQVEWSEEAVLELRCVRGHVFKFSSVAYLKGRSYRVELDTKCKTDQQKT